MNYFNNIKSVNNIKAAYRKLAFQHHPDRGGDVETMQIINGQYQAALKNCHRQDFTGTDNKVRTYYYDEKIEVALMEKIQGVLALELSGIEISLVGTWLWVEGNTRPIRNDLMDLNFRWNGKRSAWYFTQSKKKYRYNDKASLNDLKNFYGSRSFDQDDAFKKLN